MRIKRPILLAVIFAMAFVIYIYLINNRQHFNILTRLSHLNNASENSKIGDEYPQPNEIVIAVVACGSRMQETLNMIKSAIVFNTKKTPLKFLIVAENNLQAGFREKLNDWQKITKNAFTYETLSPTFPTQHASEWKSLFKPCAAQRLFLPTMLSDVDSIVYMDSDTLFLSPIIETWQYFNKFNASQIVGMTPEHEDANVGWYNRFARHPYYGPLGVNSGVMLMNLTRMRSFQWNEYMWPLLREYKLKITWGDQDLINILFYYNPDKLYVVPCQFNYRPDHCMYMNVCRAPNGVQVLHGNRGYFHSDKQPLYSAIYRVFDQYELGADVHHNIVKPLESALQEQIVQMSGCGKVVKRFLMKIKLNFPKGSDDYYLAN